MRGNVAVRDGVDEPERVCAAPPEERRRSINNPRFENEAGGSRHEDGRAEPHLKENLRSRGVGSVRGCRGDLIDAHVVEVSESVSWHETNGAERAAGEDRRTGDRQAMNRAVDVRVPGGRQAGPDVETREATARLAADVVE